MLKNKSLIEFPCEFSIKIVGVPEEGFVENVLKIAKDFDENFDSKTLRERPSNSGKYLGLTVTINVTSREQLDNLYLSFVNLPMVKFVL